MGRPRKDDLTEFQNWLVSECHINDLTAYGYVSLVRGALDNNAITQDQLLVYTSSVSTKTASMFRTAWRWFVEYAVTKQIALPNPFGPRRRSVTQNTPGNYMQRLSDMGYAQGSVLGAVAVSSVGPTQPAVVGQTAVMTPLQSTIPAHVLEPLRKWAHHGQLGADVLIKLKWEWTRFVKETGNWVTAHPAVKYSWLVIPPSLLDTLGEWGYGEERPEEGPLIPKSHRSTEPFPKLALHLLIGDGT